MENNDLSRNSSIEQIDNAREVVYDALADFFWNKVLYTAAFTPFTVTTSSTAEKIERFRDTSANRFMSASSPCKLRISFYHGTSLAAQTATTYITTAHTRDETPTATAINDQGARYVGIKIDLGKVYICSYSPEKNKENLIDTGITITTDRTYLLEINFTPGEPAQIYLDKVFLGAVTKDIPRTTVDNEVFYPVFISMKRNGGTNFSLNIDFYEFLYQRN